MQYLTEKWKLERLCHYHLTHFVERSPTYTTASHRPYYLFSVTTIPDGPVPRALHTHHPYSAVPRYLYNPVRDTAVSDMSQFSARPTPLPGSHALPTEEPAKHSFVFHIFKLLDPSHVVQYIHQTSQRTWNVLTLQCICCVVQSFTNCPQTST